MAKHLGFGTGTMGLGKGKHQPPTDQTVASVVPSVSSISVEPGQTFSIGFVAKNAAGQVLTGKTFTATSSIPTWIGVQSVSGSSATFFATGVVALGATITIHCSGIDSAPIPVTPLLILSRLTLAPTAASLPSGGSVTLSVGAFNRFGMQLPQTPLTPRSSVPGIVSFGAVSASNLVVNAANAGTTNVSVASASIVSNPASVAVAAPPVTLVATSYRVTPANLSPAANTTDVITAQLLDQNNNPFALAGRTVTWSFAQGTGTGGSFSAVSSVTDANGVATITLTVGSGQQYRVVATDFAGCTGQSALFASGAAGGGGGGGGHPNEPAGFTMVANQPMESLSNAFYGPSDPGGGGRLSIVSDPDIVAAGGSSANVAQLLYPAGFGSGSAPESMYPVGYYPVKPKTIYIHFFIKISSNWKGEAAGINKIHFVSFNIGGNDPIGSAVMELVAMGGIDESEQTLQPSVSPEGAISWNGIQAPSFTFAINRAPHGPGPNFTDQVTRGVWHRFEAICVMNTPGNEDGGLKWWWDGVLMGDYLNQIRWQGDGAASWCYVVWSPTWGGGGGDTVPADQTMDMKDLYISGNI